MVGRGALLCLALLLFAACERDAPIAVNDYTARLSRTLDLPVADKPIIQPIRLPRKRDLSLTYSEESIDLLEFLRMGDCELQQLVAERNSSLGRLAQPSQRLVYEINFLRAGMTCVDELEGKGSELADRLRSVLDSKAQELPMRIWEALPGGEEFRSFWAASGSLPDAQVIQAVSQLNADVSRWLSGDYAVDASQLEANLQQIALGGGGRVLNSWSHLKADLEVATRLLNARAASKPLCFEGMHNPEADIFKRVVNLFFVAGVQKDVAALNRVTFDLMQQINALEGLLQAIEPAAYSRWREQRAETVQLGRQSVTDHVAAIQPLFLQCGFLPGDQTASIFRFGITEAAS